MPLTLRLPVSTDEARVRELNATCSTESFDFLAGAGQLSPNAASAGPADETGGVRSDWADFLESVRCQHRGDKLPPGWLPADFLLAEVHGAETGIAAEPTLVGRSSIRYGLTENLLNYDGHIGYAVAPDFRRRGYATEILRQSLARLADHGIHRALLTCDDDNAGSAAVIEANGGILEDLRTKPGDSVPKRRYWIPC